MACSSFWVHFESSVEYKIFFQRVKCNGIGAGILLWQDARKVFNKSSAPSRNLSSLSLCLKETRKMLKNVYGDSSWCGLQVQWGCITT